MPFSKSFGPPVLVMPNSYEQSGTRARKILLSWQPSIMRNVSRAVGVGLLTLTASALAPSQTKNDWEALQYLVGEWVGEGGGSPDEGSGGFSFTSELQGQIVIRKNWAQYPATKDRPAFRHDDLMILYRQGDRVRAEYFDNERHVIRYAVQFSPDAN